LIRNLSVHEDVMLRHAREGFSTASELAAVMLREKGTPWRVAHAIVAGVVRKLDKSAKTAAAITPGVIDEVAIDVTGKPLGLSDDSIQAAIDPTRFVEAMVSQGGAAPSEVKRMIVARRRELARDESRQVARSGRLADADARLEAAVEGLARN